LRSSFECSANLARVDAGTQRSARGLPVLAIGFVIALVVVGCGGDEDSPTVSAQDSGSPPAGETGVPTESTESTSGPAGPGHPARVQPAPTTGPAGSQEAETVDAELGPSGESLGVYVGPGNVDGVRQFSAWLGNGLDRALDYIDASTWSSIESPTWTTSQWEGSGYRMDLGVPMIPDSGGSLDVGARGGYNSSFVELAENLVANGQAGAIIRLGWEFNLSWFRWYAGSNPGAYAAYFRQIVRAMRSVGGQHFAFEWNPSIGGGVALERAYPGDQYVDYIGLDVYDQSWIPKWRNPKARWNNYKNQPYGLRWHRDFSARHDKPMTFPEWGLVDRFDGHGGGDNPHFIAKMHTWIGANNVANHFYFESESAIGDSELLGGGFPRSAARFKQLFGRGTS
jgi:Glycosyl hydrolase family 26